MIVLRHKMPESLLYSSSCQTDNMAGDKKLHVTAGTLG